MEFAAKVIAISIVLLRQQRQQGTVAAGATRSPADAIADIYFGLAGFNELIVTTRFATDSEPSTVSTATVHAVARRRLRSTANLDLQLVGRLLLLQCNIVVIGSEGSKLARQQLALKPELHAHWWLNGSSIVAQAAVDEAAIDVIIASSRSITVGRPTRFTEQAVIAFDAQGPATVTELQQQLPD